MLALARSLAAAGYSTEIVADRIDQAAISAHGLRCRFPLGSSALQLLGRRLLSRERSLALRERAVMRSHPDIVISDGDLRQQDVVLVHNIVRREVEELADPGDGHLAAAALQERNLRNNGYRLVLANSQLTRTEFLRCFGGPDGRVAVVYPGYDPTQFDRSQREPIRAALRQTLGVLPGQRLIGFISSGHYSLRGADVAAATLARLDAAERRDLRILAVGSEHNTGRLGESLARLGLGNRLIVQPRSDAVQTFYHAVDILFHPAHFETFGLVVLEAAACGTPVLTSAAVGASELFSGVGAAAVVARPAADLFAPVFRRLIAEPGFAQTVADSQSRSVCGYTWDGYGRSVIELLRRHPAGILG